MRNGVDFFNAEVWLQYGRPFIHDFELEPKGDTLSADGGGQDTEERTVIDLPS
jgi:hypothetical protein